VSSASAPDARRPPADVGVYGFLPYRNRPKIVWPDNARIAVYLAPNIEIYEFDPPRDPTYHGWQRPKPDTLFYSRRDYGNRSGFTRMMRAMEKFGARGTVSLNVAVCDHYPEIIEACCARDWELFSHGIYNTRYFYNLDRDQQREVVADAAETILRHSGQRLDGWLTPAITPTHITPHVLAEMGIAYTCDYAHDDQPLPLQVASRMISMPYSFEVNDYIAFMVRGLSPDDYLHTLKAQFDRLYMEGAESGTVMSIPLHPYLIGQPHRVGALERALEYIVGHSGVWLTTGREIAAHFERTSYDAFRAMENQA